jgi:hypothetical protein
MSVLISYNDCLTIRSLFPNWSIAPVSWAYGMNASKASSEILISSFLAVIRALRPAGHHGLNLNHRCDTRGARPALGSICSRSWRVE